MYATHDLPLRAAAIAESAGPSTTLGAAFQLSGGLTLYTGLLEVIGTPAHPRAAAALFTA